MSIAKPKGEFWSLSMGGDPEFYLSVDGKIVSAHKAVPNSTRTNHGIKRDGAAIEFEIFPNSCRDTLTAYSQDYMQAALSAGRSAFKSAKSITLSNAPKVELDPNSVADAPLDIFEFGCAPDFNAYSMRQQHPVCEEGSLTRYTGGHLHLGIHTISLPEIQEALSRKFKESPFQMTKYGRLRARNLVAVEGDDEADRLEFYGLLAQIADIMIGVPIVAVLGEHYADGEADRRKLYGQAGSFRVPRHGFEYRVLSSRFWLSPVWTYLTYGLLRNTYGLFNGRQRSQYFAWRYDSTVGNGGHIVVGDETLPTVETLKRILMLLHKNVGKAEQVQAAINNHDVELAEKITKNLLSFFAGKDSGSLKMDQTVAVTIALMMEANHKGLTFHNDIMTNWGLEEGRNDNWRDRLEPYGIHEALMGRVSETLLPQRPVYESYAKPELYAQFGFGQMNLTWHQNPSTLAWKE